MDRQDIEHRLTELEIKASFQEDTLDQLNTIVVRQQQQIEWLMRELHALKSRPAAADLPAVRSLRDELPPHY
ncbi:MAG: SlyX family protein [Burkholderiales bacterium]|nr:SlyX family protein [Burkholderiales bacterium]